MQNQEDKQKEQDSTVEQTPGETANSAENLTEPTENEQTVEAKLSEMNDKYLRLYSEFDNYRKRTLKERSDLIKTASEDVFKSILPIIDDLDRAVKANEQVEDAAVIREGLSLITNKLKNITAQKGLVGFESKGLAFDPDLMEAITHIPAPTEEDKGKVIDEVEKGYKLGDKVIRFAKVVIAQ